MRISSLQSRLTKCFSLGAVLITVFAGAQAAEDAPFSADTFRKLEEQMRPSMVDVYVLFSADGLTQNTYDVEDRELQTRINVSGSGFITNEQGAILTNAHVVEGASAIFVKRAGTRIAHRVKTRASSKELDLALLQGASEIGGKPVQWGDSSAAAIGQWVGIFGNALGHGFSMSIGIIGAKNRSLILGEFENYLQLSAWVNRGNSGGPVVDLFGRVLGVATLKDGRGDGVSWAIPVSMVKPILKQFYEKGSYRRPWFGFTVARASGQKNCRISIDRVSADSPAQRAGLKTGDRICSFNRIRYESPNELSVALIETDLVGKVALEVEDASGKTRSLEIQPIPQPQLGLDTLGDLGSFKLGVQLADLNFSLRHKFDLDAELEGALVQSVGVQSLAERSGIRVHDIIIEAQGQPVNSVQALVQAMSRILKSGEKRAVLSVLRAPDKKAETTAWVRRKIEISLK